MSESNEPMLLQSIRDAMQQVLVVVGHDEQEASDGASALMNTITQFALTYLVVDHDKDVQDALLKQVEAAGAAEAGIAIIYKATEDKEKIPLAFRDATADVLGSYFRSISSTLEPEQTTKINDIMEQLQRTIASS